MSRPWWTGCNDACRSPALEGDWDTVRGTSRLTWNEARDAAKDSFERVRNALERDPAGIAGP